MRKSCLIACAVVLCAASAYADVVADWNLRAGQSIAAGARRGPSGAFDFAMVHLAMHDAIQSYERRFEPYCIAVPNPIGSPVAAAATAAHDVLVALFPAQQLALDVSLAVSLDKYNVTGDPGVAVGTQAAACMLQRLAADNQKRAEPDTFIGGLLPGDWQPTAAPGPLGPTPIVAQFIATFTPFGLTDPAQLRTANGPPPLTSGAYAKAYNEVKEKGALVGSTRTQEETDIARFFADGPPNYWFRLLRDLAETQSLGDNGRMFALAGMSLADALISAWDSKIAWNFWRPLTAIRLGESDGNPHTIGDPDWRPLFGTPNYPDYTSGANNAAGAVCATLQNLLGTDDLVFTLHSATAPPSPAMRSYTRLSDAMKDVVDARIYMGIHFRFADTAAIRQGTRAANWAFGHYLRPIEPE